jgi:hypothetical protein
VEAEVEEQALDQGGARGIHLGQAEERDDGDKVLVIEKGGALSVEFGVGDGGQG